MENKKYFCDECGARFTAEPPKPTNFLPPAVRCPRCGCYCCYEDTNKGRAESVRDLTEYENEIETE